MIVFVCEIEGATSLEVQMKQTTCIICPYLLVKNGLKKRNMPIRESL